MATKELMGLLCLAILWVNSLLLVGAAMGPLRELLARLGRLGRELVTGRILRGDADGALAEHWVAQVGRKLGDEDAILFHDKSFHGVVHGGAVAVGADELPIAPCEDGTCEVWVDSRRRRSAAECDSAATFDPALVASRKAKGYLRDVRMTLVAGSEVWLCPATGDSPTWIADFDPHGWCRRRVALTVAYQALVLALTAGITYLALYPPIFGTISTIGGVTGLLYFILIQPVGVIVRELTLPQHRAELCGSWKRPVAADAVARVGEEPSLSPPVGPEAPAGETMGTAPP